MKITWLTFSPIATIILLPRYTRRYKVKLIFNYLKLDLLNSFSRKQSKNKIIVKILGYKIHAVDYNNLLVLFREIFMEEQYFFKFENDHPTIIDCGANIGLASIYFKFLYPDCHIYAFEPDKTSYELFKLNILENNLKNVEIINAALSDREGLIEYFHDPDSQSSVSNSIIFELMPKSKVMVNSMLLSSFLGDKKIDFAKLDVEGAERQIINDLVLNNKLTNIREYIIEYHHIAGEPKFSIGSFLILFEKNKYEYQIRADCRDKKKFSVFLLNCYKLENESISHPAEEIQK